MAADPISNPSSSSGVGVGEAPIELLKNTPSNIAKLEDVIDQCKGREKYLARTRSPSDGEDVRWYFCKVPLAENVLAASVPQTTVVGKGEYFRFAMRDSLALEASFLQREEDLLSAWWKEYGECSEGPSGRNINALPNLDLQSKSHSSEGDQPTEPCEDEEERVGVPVKGGLYEVDLAKRHCFPVYWNGENRRVLRGHWFARKDSLDWLPLREDVAEQLEFAYRRQVWHRRTFQPSGLFAARVNLQGPLPGLHALFTGEDDTWEAWLNNDTSGFSSIINLKGNGIKLRRGYSPSGSPKPTQDEIRQQKEEEMDDYCSQARSYMIAIASRNKDQKRQKYLEKSKGLIQVPVQHLVFMVHGIGQRLEKANLVDDVGNFRQITASLAERHLSSYQRDTQRVLFIPCQWRRGLKLGSESTVDNITLDGVRGLRIMLSATAHDILYYMSPIYCQEIMNSVSNQLNLLYNKFLKRNPGYDGKVSIYAHSLGSVLSYDILCHQDDFSSLSPLKPVYKEHVTEEHPNQNGEPSQLRSILCSENNNSDTATEKLDSFQEENTEVQDAIANDSPNSELQHAALMTHPDRNPELCQQSIGPKLSSDLSSEDLHKPCPSLSLEGKNSEVCSGDVDNMQEDLHKQCPSAYLEDKNSGVCSGHVDNLPEDLHKPCSSASLEDNNNVICSGDVDNRQEHTSNNTNDKEKLIELLRKEVDSLKARIGDLESKNSDEDSKVNHQDDSEGGNTPNQCISGKRLEKLSVRNYYTPSIKYTKLDFKVDTFFAVGSPLGVFLALRNVRLGIGNGKDYWQDESIIEEMPACRQMFNIFHPFDPVAYRVDPLVCKEYVNKRPVTIPYHKGGKRLHIGLQDFTEDLALRSQAVVNQFNSITVKVISVCQSRKNDDMDETATSSSDYDERSYGSLMMERLTGNREGQIDHMLQDKTFEHQYISAIGSHTNYWRDYDTALFILNHLYRDIPEEPDSPVQSEANNSNIQKAPKGRRFYQSDTVDDELPLTFSDRMNAREFSRKVRRAIKKNS